MVMAKSQLQLRKLALALSVTALTLGLGGCPPWPPVEPKVVPTTQPTTQASREEVFIFRQQELYLDLPERLTAVPMGSFTDDMSVKTLHLSTDAATRVEEMPTFTVWAIRARLEGMASVEIEQLSGAAEQLRQRGAWLEPLGVLTPGQSVNVPAGVNLALKVTAGAALLPGTVKAQLTTKNGRQEVVGSHELNLQISEVVLPQEAVQIALATARLRAISAVVLPTWQEVGLPRREDPTVAPLIAALDALVKQALAEGVVLGFEDVSPVVRLDDVGRVTVSWDSYDALVGPWLEAASGASGRVLPSWLVPPPPRRVRDEPAQLRQYWEACLQHAQQRGWTAKPVLFHTALLEAQGEDAGRTAVRQLASKEFAQRGALVDNLTAGMLPDGVWALPDASVYVPPVGDAALPETVRVWPWLVRGRLAQGLVWRDAVGIVDEVGTPPRLFMLRAADGVVGPTPRLAWLKRGLDEVVAWDLLRRRGEPTMAADVLVEMVGRLGLQNAGVLPYGGGETPGALRAGGPESLRVGQELPAMLDRLIRVSTPGLEQNLKREDPTYLAARMWLNQAYRPVARVAGRQYELQRVRDGWRMSMEVAVQVESAGADVRAVAGRWLELPEPINAGREPVWNVPALGVSTEPAGISGPLDKAWPADALRLQVRDRTTSATYELPVQVPLLAVARFSKPPVMDGDVSDWDKLRDPDEPKTDQPIAVRYLNRPALLNQKLETVNQPGTFNGGFDAEYLYLRVQCPQGQPDDDRTSARPAQVQRWWGTDGVQVLVSGGSVLRSGRRLVRVAVKPSGMAQVQAANVEFGQPIVWADGPGGLLHAVRADAQGYAVELAIPRRWFVQDEDAAQGVPMWRVNVLRYENRKHQGTTWAGPMVHDDDVGQMGLIYGWPPRPQGTGIIPR